MGKKCEKPYYNVLFNIKKKKTLVYIESICRSDDVFGKDILQTLTLLIAIKLFRPHLYVHNEGHLSHAEIFSKNF